MKSVEKNPTRRENGYKDDAHQSNPPVMVAAGGRTRHFHFRYVENDQTIAKRHYL